MLRDRTVFIVGAGASAELGLPIGVQLARQIGESATRGDNRSNAFGLATSTLRDVLSLRVNKVDAHKRGPEIAAYESSLDRLRRGLRYAPSIDNFLHAHAHNERLVEVAKLAIADRILAAEGESLLAQDSRLNRTAFIKPTNDAPPTIWDTWYPLLTNLLLMGQDQKEAHKIFEKVGFIVFNYDRCLEYFLSRALEAYFDIPSQRVYPIMRQLNIVHPYGRVGDLPWDGPQKGVLVGERDPRIIDEISSSIKTFTESAEEGVVSKSRSLLKSAHTVVFLGFGFLRQNLELLTLDEPSAINRVYYTTYDIHENDLQDILYRIRTALKCDSSGFVQDGGTCKDLMYHNRYQLEAA